MEWKNVVRASAERTDGRGAFSLSDGRTDVDATST